MTISSSVDQGNTASVVQSQAKTPDKNSKTEKDSSADSKAASNAGTSASDKVSISLAGLQTSTGSSSAHGRYYNKKDLNKDGMVSKQEETKYDVKHGIVESSSKNNTSNNTVKAPDQNPNAEGSTPQPNASRYA